MQHSSSHLHLCHSLGSVQKNVHAVDKAGKKDPPIHLTGCHLFACNQTIPYTHTDKLCLKYQVAFNSAFIHRFAAINLSPACGDCNIMLAQFCSLFVKEF